MIWKILVFAAAVLLLIFLLWKEINRAQKQRLIWRLLASFLAVASLVCLAIPPFYQGKRSISNNQEIVLLTDGFNKDSLPSPQQKTLIYTADEAVFQSNKSPQIKRIADLGLWRKSLPANTVLHILGNGFDEDELQDLDSIPVRFNAPEIASGIQKINWMQRLKTGEALRVQGRFINTNNAAVKLVLQGLNTGLDSVKIADKNSIDFSFSTVPKQNGQAVFRLLALARKDTLENEAIPVMIEPAKSLKVLLLSASPDFESRFLQNWLAENNYAVAARSTISKNKTATAFANINKFSLDKINSNLLQNFDVVIADGTAFGDLSAAEKSAILNQENRQGLGLIIRADSSTNASFIKQNFVLQPLQNPQQNLSLKLNDAAGTRLNIQSDHPLFIKNQAEAQTLVQEKSGKQLASIKLSGIGKLVLTTLNNTFSWQLSGNKNAYKAFWSLLLSKATKKITQKENLSRSFLADKNSMTTLNLESANANPSLKFDGQIALTQNPAVPFVWQGSFWPKRSGWQNGIYIQENNSWKTIRAEKKIRSTLKYAAKINLSLFTPKKDQQKQQIFVPPVWFYFLFLLSAAFLWFETKLL